MAEAWFYLRIPREYGDRLGGLRWSDSAEAVEYPDGKTFAFRQEIARFLEGFASVRPLIHFAHVLHLLDLIGLGRLPDFDQRPPAAWKLSAAFGQEARAQPPQGARQQHRNAGVFCARLCEGVPPAPGLPRSPEVCAQVLHCSQMSVYYASWADPRGAAAIDPPLAPATFEAQVLAALDRYSFEEVRHWLRHGCGPVQGAGEPIARALAAAKPPSLAQVLAPLTERPRLAGAARFVAQLASALTLPPRRLAQRELPMGGYADVATRGHPEQILPSQFAVDDLEFVRRYAENELLYFRREEPQARQRDELLLVLDQGVRTWGEVRLVLSAAVLAFGRLAERRRLPFRIAVTGTPDIYDPLQVGRDKLGELLEASDLTANPGLALERVLEGRAESPRDVVLLTHPRSLAEADVTAAARRADPNTRLFAVAVDEPGEVLFAELKHGAPVKLCQFQVHPAEPPRPISAILGTAWRGDVEPVGYPFPLGIVGTLEKGLFDLDHAGEWLLTVSRGGILHAWKADGTGREVLPCGMFRGQVLSRPEAVLGVAGGFVVAGRLGNWLVAMHYDFAARTCACRLLGSALNTTWQWFYFHAHQVVVARSTGLRYALDLALGDCHTFEGYNPHSSSRAQAANQATQPYPVPPPQVYLAPEGDYNTKKCPFLWLDRGTGQLHFGGTNPPWPPFTPVADGLPALQGGSLLEARHAGNTLAVLSRTDGGGQEQVLRLFRGPEGTPLGEFTYYGEQPAFALSGDGRVLAREVPGEGFLEVHDLTRPGEPPFRTTRGKVQRGPAVELGEQWLTIEVGNMIHLARWDRRRLDLSFARGDRDEFLRRGLAGTHRSTRVRADRAGLPAPAAYDRVRFVAGARLDVALAVDVFGQVAVFDLSGELICMFFASRERLAVWMPDGTCYGPPALTGRPVTPGALDKIGAALWSAFDRGRRPPP
jgi:hypothetical protein